MDINENKEELEEKEEELGDDEDIDEDGSENSENYFEFLNKSSVAKEIALQFGVSHATACNIYDHFFYIIKREMRDRGQLKIKNFGKFYIETIPHKTRYNYYTNDYYTTLPKCNFKFVPYAHVRKDVVKYVYAEKKALRDKDVEERIKRNDKSHYY